VHEYALDRDFARRIGLHEFRDMAVDLEQSSGHRAVPDPDTAAGNIADAGPAGIDHAIACDPRTGVEAEYADHGSYDNGSP
jgi:hypothetical protein